MQSLVFWQLSAAGCRKKFHKISKHVHTQEIVRVNLLYTQTSNYSVFTYQHSGLEGMGAGKPLAECLVLSQAKL